MELSTTAYENFRRHVVEEFPKEACGVIVEGSYVPCLNIHETPEQSFRISPQSLIKAQALGPIQCLLHSHPYDKTFNRHNGCQPEYPSAKDMEGFNACGYPWGIVATDGEGLSDIAWLDESVTPPLEGRLFFWGITDCYSLVRDWYKVNREITLVNVPREWGFWDEEGAYNPFMDFEKYGWREVSVDQASIGDMVLIRMGDRRAAGIVNHCGVISGPNELLHQTFGSSYSRTTRLDRWQASIAKYLRYESETSQCLER